MPRYAAQAEPVVAAIRRASNTVQFVSLGLRPRLRQDKAWQQIVDEAGIEWSIGIVEGSSAHIPGTLGKAEGTVAAFREVTANEAPPVSLPQHDEEAFAAIARNSSNANYMQDEHTLKNTGKEFTDRF